MIKKRVVVGISGGVDSSVAALILKQQGYDVIGLFMKNWEDEDTTEYCSSRQDFIDAASVTDIINIPLEIVNFSTEYKERVFGHFLAKYRAGQTPNPDILCNSEIKFKAFLDYAVTLGADYIATGHYAKIREVGRTFQLLKGEDGNKDQSYFLYRLNQKQLAKTLFPIGHLYKSEVRRIAQDFKLSNFAKKDSTGICFIGERPFRDFLGRYLPHNPGEIKTLEGMVIGEHTGLMYHTIGQRQGLRIGGTKGGNDEPWYVSGKDIKHNILTVVQGHNHPKLFQQTITATDLTWINGEEPKQQWVYTAKIRYRQPDTPCSITDIKNGKCSIEFAQPQWAVAPGQSVVIYESKVCLGGGEIES
ncbi:MAG: tRNA 2-thiouridine(34) synthase MnmA [Nitrosomonadaceae bacterium]|nr:tRNA 2-thiouridine(34) synthase MnmA [Nitrosospira sp.]MSQ04820.1 tRNA 2-thiouridine(34) synthase MnmA [Nitrosomonadaceae bacterium]